MDGIQLNAFNVAYVIHLMDDVSWMNETSGSKRQKRMGPTESQCGLIVVI